MRVSALIAKDLTLLLRSRGAGYALIFTPIVVLLLGIVAGATPMSILLLVALFMSIITAGVLTTIDVTGGARARERTTPARPRHHVLGWMITSSVLVLFLLALLFAAGIGDIARTGTALLGILIAVVLFTLLGIIIGSCMKSIEATLAAGVLVGSLVAITASATAAWSLITGPAASKPLVIFALLCVALYFSASALQRPAQSPPPRPLVLGEHVVRDAAQLLDALERMPKEQFETHVSGADNAIAAWAREHLGNRKLSRRLRTTSKEEMVHALDHHLRRHGRRIHH